MSRLLLVNFAQLASARTRIAITQIASKALNKLLTAQFESRESVATASQYEIDAILSSTLQRTRRGQLRTLRSYAIYLREA